MRSRSKREKIISGIFIIFFLIFFFLVIISIFIFRLPKEWEIIYGYIKVNVVYFKLIVYGIIYLLVPKFVDWIIPQNSQRNLFYSSLFYFFTTSGLCNWLNGNNLNYNWIIIIFGFFFIVYICTFLILLEKNRLLLIFENTSIVELPSMFYFDLDDFFNKQYLPYYAIPAGIFVTVLLDIFNLLKHELLIKNTLILIFWFALVSLFFIQIKIFKLMIKPKFDLRIVFTKIIATKKQNPFYAVLINFRPEIEESKKYETALLDLSIVMGDIRRLFLYNSIYISVLIFLTSILTFLLFEPVSNNIFKYFILIIFLLLYLVGVQIPYLIGQRRLHNEILSEFIGTQKEDISEKLIKYSPTFPKYNIIKSLTIGGTAGGIILYFLIQMIKKFYR
jgi:hypothetical protein